MKKLLITFIIVLFQTGIALAHPPKEIQVKAVDATQIKVTIVHDTNDQGSHYIEKIVVSLNGKKVITQNCQFQQSKEAQKAIYNLPELIQNPGATIMIYATCNKGGKLTKELILGK